MEDQEPGATLQKLSNSDPDTTRVKLLLKLSSFYFSKPALKKADKDSALLLYTQAVEFSHHLKFFRGAADAMLLVDKIYGAEKSSDNLQATLSTLNDTGRIKLLLEMAKYKMYNSVRKKGDMDTALSYTRKALVLSESVNSVDFRTKSLLQFAYYYYWNYNPRQGKETFQKAFDYCRKARYLPGEISVCLMIGTCIVSDETLFNLLLNYRNQMLVDYKEQADRTVILNMQRKIIKALIISAGDHYYENRTDLTEKESLWAIELGKIDDSINVRPYNDVAFLYIVKGNLSKALSYSLEATRIQEKPGNTIFNESTYENIGKIYFDLGKFEQSLEYYKKAISIVQKKGMIVRGGILKNTTKAYIGMNKPQEALSFLRGNTKPETLRDPASKTAIAEAMGNCYNALGKYDKAEEYYLESLKDAKSIGKIEMLIAFFPLSKLYIRTRQYAKAISYLKELVTKSTSAMVPLNVQSESYFMLFKADSALGNYLTAINYLHQYKALNDSIFNDTKNKQVEELKVQYETDKKDQQLRLKEKDINLLAKQGQLQHTVLQQTKVSRNVFIGGAIMLTLLLGLAFNRYGLKQRSNNKLQKQQSQINQQNHTLQLLIKEQQKLLEEKEWLVKEIHHRVKNNLQIVVSLLNTQAAHLQEGDALMAIQQSRHRIQVISLLHQKLYQAETSSLIDMQVYIREVVSFLKDSFSGINHLYFNQQIDAISLDISQAVSVGLILNEAVTNCIKYAFPNNINGNIKITFTKEDDERLLLIVTDNGVGITKDIDPSQRNSLGMQLMQTLSEQLDGNMQIENKEGTIVKVCFRQQVVERINDTAYNI
ncbi:MAG: histidine kinase dimerization/phosphoacceptor domain -containing protein [Chitinophagaceae bacterium]